MSPKRRDEIPFYFVCENCNCKFFNDVSPCGCPRCGETLVSTERIQPPWKIKLHTVAETAEILNCSESTVRSLITRGLLEHHRSPGIRVTDTAIVEFLQNSKQERQEPEPRQRQPRLPRLRHVHL